jgi:hypothetical protein
LGDHLVQQASERGGITRTAQPSSLAVLDHVTDTSDVGSDNRPTGSEGFDQGYGCALVAARKHHNVQVGQRRGDICPPAREVRTVRYPELVSQRFERGPKLAVTEHSQVQARHACHGRKQRCVVLHRYQSSQGAGERDVLRNTEHGAQPSYRPTWRTDREERRQVEAQRYDSVLRRLADPEVEQLVSHLGAHGDEDVGVLGKDAFELDEGPLLRTGKVTLQDMAMERVDQPWAQAPWRR